MKPLLIFLLLCSATVLAQVAPTGFTAKAAAWNQIDLTWTHPGTNVDDFLIERSDGNKSTYKALITVAQSAKVNRSFTDDKVVGSTLYYYRISTKLGTKLSATVEANATTPAAPKPGPPTGLVLEPGLVTMVVKWNSSGAPTQLEYAPNVNYMGSITRDFKLEQSVTVDGLTPNTPYYFRIKKVANNGLPESNWAETKATTQDAKPSTPTNLKPQSKTANSITMGWDGINSAFTNYQVRIANNTQFNNPTLQPAGTAKSTTLANLQPSTTYYLQVRAQHILNNIDYPSDWSGTVSVDTDAPPKPAPPTGFQPGTITSISMALNWNSGGKATTLEYSRFADYSQATTLSFTTEQSTTLSRLLAGTLYYLRLKIKAAGTTPESDWVTLNASTKVASPPGGLVVTGKTTSSLSVKWDVLVEANSYEARISTTNTFPNAPVVSTSGTTYTFPNLSPGQTYYVQVRANTLTNTDAYSGWSATVSATTDVPPKPAPPTGLIAKAPSPTQIDVNWNSGSVPTQLDYATNANFTGATSRLFKAEQSVNLSPLTPGTTYFFRIKKSVNGDTPESDWTATVNTTTPPNAPNAPTNLQLTLISVGPVDLKWTDGGGGATDFEVQRAEGSGDFTKINTVNASKTTDQDKAVQQGKTYSYRINAINAGGSALSEVKSITIPTIPAAPDYALKALSSTQIQVDYKNNAGSNATALELQYARDQNFTVGLGGQNPPLGGSPVVIPSLQPDTKYYFRLRATNDKTVLASDWVLKDISTLAAPITKPNAPTTLKLTGSGDGRQLTLGWTDVSDNETRFDIQYSESADFANPTSASVGIGITTLTVNGLQPCKVYFVRVSSANGTGSSAWIDGKLTLNPNLPSKAVSLAATAGSSTQINLTLTYTANTEDAFELEYADNASYTSSTKRDLAKATRSEPVTGLKAATPYWFRIRAKNCAGIGEWIEMTATTQADVPQPPAAPANLKAEAASSTQINLSWNVASGLTGYKLEYADNAGFANLKTETGIAGSATSFPVQNLLANTLYYFRLYAINSAGTSPAATTDARTNVTPVTKPNAPTELQIIVDGSGTFVSVLWRDKSDNETGYEFEYADNPDFTNPVSSTWQAGPGQAIIPGLTPCKTYWMRVAATNSVGRSEWLSGKTTTTPNVPAKVANLVGTAASTSQINLSWTYTANTENGFELEYADNAAYTNSTKRTLARANRTEPVAGLQAAKSYWFRLQGTNCAGGGEWIETTATTQADAPLVLASPTSLRFATVAPVYTQLSLLWNDIATTETGYEVWRSVNDQTNWIRVAEMALNASAYTDTGLRPGVAYFYRVRAVQNTAISDWSNVITDRAPLVNALTPVLPAEVRVYPNPVTERLIINSPPAHSVYLQLFAMTGTVVLTQHTSTTGTLTVDLQNLPMGLYVLTLTADTIQFSTRIIKR